MDVVLAGDPASGIQLLTEALAKRLNGAEAAVKARREHYRGVHDEQRSDWAKQIETVRGERPIDQRWISSCINEVRDEDTLLVNEYDLLLNHVDLTRPGTFFGQSHAGGLGWALGAGLGAKLARPEKTVIATVGDGSYIFNSPISAHWPRSNPRP